MNDNDDQLKGIKSELDGIGCALWFIAIILFFTSCACVAVACTDLGMPAIYGNSPMATGKFNINLLPDSPDKTNFCAAAVSSYTDVLGGTNHVCYMTLLYAPYADDMLRIFVFTCWSGQLNRYVVDTEFAVEIRHPDDTVTSRRGYLKAHSDHMAVPFVDCWQDGVNIVTVKPTGNTPEVYGFAIVWNSANAAERAISRAFP